MQWRSLFGRNKSINMAFILLFLSVFVMVGYLFYRSVNSSLYFAHKIGINIGHEEDDQLLVTSKMSFHNAGNMQKDYSNQDKETSDQAYKESISTNKQSEVESSDKKDHNTNKGVQIKTNTNSKKKSTKYLNLQTDIVVYGGGVGGSAVAYQAGLLGARVIVVEPSSVLGGQVCASGVSQMDVGWGDREFMFGVAKKWLDIAKQLYVNKYGEPADQLYAQCHWNFLPPSTLYAHICVDPKVAQQSFVKLLSSPNLSNRVHILFNTDIFSHNPLIKNQSGKVIGLKVKNAQGNVINIHAKVVVDASEFGDLIPDSGAAFYAGRGGPFHNYNGALQWAQAHQTGAAGHVQDITYVANMRKLDTLLPTQIYNLYTTKIADIHSSFYHPSQWTSKIYPGRTDHMCNTFKSIGNHFPWPVYFEYRYRAVGDRFLPYNKIGLFSCSDKKVKKITKTSLNHFNDSEFKVIGLLDWQNRKSQICQAKKITIEEAAFLEKLNYPDSSSWFLSREDWNYSPRNNTIVTNCSSIPDDIERYLPPIPYVRESIRIYSLFNKGQKGGQMHVNDVKRFTPFYRDSVAIASYGFDLHDKYTPPLGVHSAPFQIPFNTMIPVDASGNVIKGFLVAEKNLGFDRYVQGATREQPPTFATGQAVGTIAYLSLAYNGDISKVKPVDVQIKLVTTVGAKLTPVFYKDVEYQNFGESYKYAEWLSTVKIMGGYKADRYGVANWKPGLQVTRGIAAVTLFRLINALGISPSSLVIRDYNNQFTDINCFCKQAVIFLYKAGITNGCKIDKYCPANSILYPQMVVMLTRLFKNYVAAHPNTMGCSSVVLPSTFPSYARSYAISAAKSGILDVVKSGNTCRIKYFIDKCGLSGYNTCTAGNSGLNRLELGKMLWHVYTLIKHE